MQAWQWAPGATPFLVSLKFMLSICVFGGPGPGGMNTTSREYQGKMGAMFFSDQRLQLIHVLLLLPLLLLLLLLLLLRL